MTLAARRLLAVGLILAAAASAARPSRSEEAFTPVKSSVRYRKIGVYDKARLAAIIETDLDAFLAGSTMKRGDFKGSLAPPRHAVALYEVQFDSVIPEWNNEPTMSGGLLAIPDDGETSHPLLSYQHGTVFGLDEVPSRPDNSFETRLMLAAFAAQGYVVIGADYFGLGASRVGPSGRRAPNSFIVPEGTVQAMLDHFRASGEVLAALGQRTPQTFLYGWSQGGWSTMQFLRRLEALELPVTAAATVSAPVDPAATGRGRFWETLELTGAYRWRIKTPLRAYAGGTDEAIPAEVSRMVVEFDQLLGGRRVEFFSAGERADHRASFVQATLDLEPWLDSFVKPAVQ